VTEEMRPCSSCSKWIEARAIECRYCGAKATTRIEDVQAKRAEEREGAEARDLAARAERARLDTELANREEAAFRTRFAAAGAQTSKTAVTPMPNMAVGVWVSLIVVVTGLLLAFVGQGTRESGYGGYSTPEGPPRYDYVRMAIGSTLATLAVEWLLIRGAVASAIRLARRKT
jgi:hypothetical protein